MAAVKTQTRRAERAAGTRRAIIAAARKLFMRDGYAATTLAAVADEASVAVQTVYAVYASKAGILRALGESVVREPAAEETFRRAMAERDPHRKIELLARSIRHRWESGHDVVVIYQDAATADPALRAEVEKILRRRRDGLLQLVRTLEPNLEAGLDVRAAGAIMDALTMPELYRELTHIHKWSADAYERWLVGALGQIVA